jgi:hypothetical protein
VSRTYLKKIMPSMQHEAIYAYIKVVRWLIIALHLFSQGGKELSIG